MLFERKSIVFLFPPSNLFINLTQNYSAFHLTAVFDQNSRGFLHILFF